MVYRRVRRRYRLGKYRTRRKFYRKFYKRVLNRRATTMINPSRPGLNIPINPRYLTKFTLSFSGYTTTATDGTSGYFALKLNSPYRPVDVAGTTLTSPNFTGANNRTGLSNGISGAATLEALFPRGYSQLASDTMYQKYRVYASKIRVTVVPGAQADTSIVTVIPITDVVGLGEFAGLSQNVAFSKERVVTQGADNNANTVSNYIDMQSLYGKTKAQIMADDEFSASYNDDPVAGKLGLWLVKYNKLNGSANYVSQLSFNIEVIYYTELNQVNYESMDINIV